MRERQTLLAVGLLLVLSCATGGHRETLTSGEHDFVTPDGVRLRYKVAGQGRPVVMLLHGGPGSNYNAVWPDLESNKRKRSFR